MTLRLRPARPHDAERSPGPGAASLLPSLFILIVVAQQPAALLASGLFDNIYTVIDSSWRKVTIVEGNAARNVQVLAMVTLAGLAVHLILTALRRPPVVLNILAVTATVVVGANLLRGPSASELLGSVTYVLVIWAAALTSARRQALRWLGWFAAVYWVTNWLFILTGSEAALKECRPDKCSYLGVMLVGYTQHEQTLGLYTAQLLPFVALLPRWARLPVLTLGLATLLATGSRTALLASVLALVAFGWLASLRRSEDGTDLSLPRAEPFRPFVAILPLSALVFATLLFFLLPSQALTGRGQLWKVLREALPGDVLFGPGRGALEHGYAVGDVTFLTVTEHNQAGYLLTVGGVVGLVLFTLGLLQLALQGLRPGGTIAAVALMAASTGVATETVWSFDLLSGSTSWTLILAVFLQVSRSAKTPGHRSAWTAIQHRLRRDWRMLVGGTLASAILGIALAAAAPARYVSTSHVFLTIPQQGVYQQMKAEELTQARARTYRVLVNSPWVMAEVLDRSQLLPDDIRDVDVEVPHDTTILQITATADSPDVAQRAAQALSAATSDRLPQLDPQLHATTLTAGPPEVDLQKPGFVRSAMAGATLGALVVLALSVVRRADERNGSRIDTTLT